jgi:hypothetical protein
LWLTVRLGSLLCGSIQFTLARHYRHSWLPMPQWTGDRAAFDARHPDERWSASCPVDGIALLLQYDHHVIWLGGRPAVLLTYAWHEVEDRSAPLRCEVSFAFAKGHPTAPPEVQALAGSLSWTVVPDPRAAS